MAPCFASPQSALSGLAALAGGTRQPVHEDQPRRVHRRDASARAAALAEIARALKPGGFLVVVEVVFDPHFQSRSTVTKLAMASGLRERALFGHGFAYVIHFEKPDGA